MTKNHVVRRKNGNFSFRITIPESQRNRFGGKQEIWETLKTSNRTVANALASQKVLRYKSLFLSYQAETEAPLSYKDSADKAALLGFEFHSAQEIFNAPPSDKVKMLGASLDFIDVVGIPTRQEVALIGGVVSEALSLDQMFTRYQELAAGKWNDLDRRARQKKWNRYAEPVADFKRTMGDLDVLTITTKQASNYAVDLGKRIEAGKLKSETAKKKLLFLNAIFQKVLKADFPDRKNPFERVELEHDGNDKGRRRPLTELEIGALHEKLSASTANDELKAVLHIIEHTGATAKEIVLLHESDFHLEEDIPYVHIGPNPNRKSLKTKNRPRLVPLVGLALEAAKRFPKGFARYCRSNGSEAFGASANKIIKQVAEDATTYSFRHRFIDALRDVDGIQDSLIQHIVGHDSSMTGKYGKGFSLKKKQEAIIAAIELTEKKRIKK
ncbi:Site-specific recombinase [Neorhizobium galegae bv. orientalis]|nr:Site-specific recombinase [Neorhizobium galegae bv. orientalis]